MHIRMHHDTSTRSPKLNCRKRTQPPSRRSDARARREDGRAQREERGVISVGTNPTALLPSGSARLALCSLRSLAANFGFRVQRSLNPDSEVRIPKSEPRPNSEDRNPKSRRLEKSSRRPNRNTLGFRPSDLVRVSAFGVRVECQRPPEHLRKGGTHDSPGTGRATWLKGEVMRNSGMSRNNSPGQMKRRRAQARRRFSSGHLHRLGNQT